MLDGNFVGVMNTSLSASRYVLIHIKVFTEDSKYTIGCISISNYLIAIRVIIQVRKCLVYAIKCNDRFDKMLY